MQRRYLSYTTRLLSKPLKVAIVGTGPGGFYTAHHLLNKSSPDVKLDLDFFEKLPTPYGLSRYGVAPDHPEVKNCEDHMNAIMEDFGGDGNGRHKVRFLGNVEIGKDVSLKDLEKNYNSIVLAYGCTSADNKLNIPGADLPAVVPARQFVNWYNGHPDYYAETNKYIPPPLDKIKTVSIIGNGNVALDVARILLADPKEHWSKTDISTEAQELLERSTVEHVRIVARRGILESAFSNKEIRELFELPVKFIPLDKELLDKLDVKKLGRVDKRRVSIIEKYSNAPPKESARSWSLEYYKSPVEFITGENSLLKATKFVKNKPADDALLPHKVVATDEHVTEDNELAILSIGYQGSPLDGFEELGIWYDGNKLHNKNGRVLSTESKGRDEHNAVFKPGWYAAGWIKNGPKGAIATTMMDSFDTADNILEDLANDKYIKLADDQAQLELPNAIDWAQWKKLNDYELQRGEELGKLRYKVCNKNEMLDKMY
ncbi:putative NADPH:adrenodoxin oxidoreductase, mitochondrial [Candida viswanathii]|uniref:NADPH:adrenodoxin oxidoreductase, mitochondrial n=1 Tax=Candida viswanathii TaxID=5486 RepID=A0A367Y2X5_9ASCO|nr:putative NADPH:adrenodoxin oxidoreductase, mitochondrial [Candida viswanathii]